MKKLKNYLCVLGAGLVCLIGLGVYQNRTPIAVHIPEISTQELDARAEVAQQVATRSAAASWARKLVACSADEDCVIVDKDPCGCIAGPKGVMAINVDQLVSFNERQNALTEGCPDNPPSTKAECSPTARPVCRKQTCTIVY